MMPRTHVLGLTVLIKGSVEVPTVMTSRVTTLYQEAQFPIIISHLLANLGYIYQVHSNSIPSTLVSTLLPFHSRPFQSSSFSSPREETQP